MFKVSQKVWCAIYGAGVVAEVDDENACRGYDIIVKFNDERTVTYTNDGKYHVEGNVTLFPYPIEITKAVTKPSIDWNHVSEDFKYLAMDADGESYLYTDKPRQGEWRWRWASSPRLAPAFHFASFTSGTCDWRDSLVERPN